MVQHGTLTRGIKKPTSFFWTNRRVLCFISSTLINLVPRVGVGYSYADFGETVETTEHAAQNVHAFITIFFEVFKQFEGRPLHLAGESYGVSDRLHDFELFQKFYIQGTVSSRLRQRNL